MSTQERADKIAAYFVLHRSRGMSVEEALQHISSDLGIPRDAVLVAIHYSLAGGQAPVQS